jgi:ribosomal protein RSM22 (predicted rRNA methylase)
LLVDLPRQLRRALEAQRDGISDAELALATRSLSERYRTGEPSNTPFIAARADVAAYAAYRLPATYAASVAVFSALAEVWPDWQPRSLLDLGAGLGSGMWAASAFWPGISKMTALDAEPLMIAAGRAIAASASQPALSSAEWRQSDLAQAELDSAFELSLLAYVLGEVEPDSVDKLIDRVWNATTGCLVVIEPGTPTGSRRVERVRDQVVALGGFELAPCPHDPPRRVPADDWTHFSVRVPRSRAHRLAKDAALNYEDEKFSYVVLARTPLDRTYSRILRHPQIRKGHIYLQLCTREGVQTVVVSKREGARYSRARKAEWGDIFEWEDPEREGNR